MNMSTQRMELSNVILGELISAIESNIDRISRNYNDDIADFIVKLYQASQGGQEVDATIMNVYLRYKQTSDIVDSIAASVKRGADTEIMRLVSLSEFLQKSGLDYSYGEITDILTSYEESVNETQLNENEVNEEPSLSIDVIYNRLLYLFEDIVVLYQSRILSLESLSYLITHIIFMFYNRIHLIPQEYALEALRHISKNVAAKVMKFYRQFLSDYVKTLQLSHEQAEELAKKTLNRVFSSKNNRNRSIERSCWANIRVIVAQVSKKYIQLGDNTRLKLYHNIGGCDRARVRERIMNILSESVFDISINKSI